MTGMSRQWAPVQCKDAGLASDSWAAQNVCMREKETGRERDRESKKGREGERERRNLLHNDSLFLHDFRPDSRQVSLLHHGGWIISVWPCQERGLSLSKRKVQNHWTQAHSHCWITTHTLSEPACFRKLRYWVLCHAMLHYLKKKKDCATS